MILRILPPIVIALIASIFVLYYLSQVCQHSQRIAQFARAWVLTMEALPALCMTLFVALVVRVRIALGYWPYPGHFDREKGDRIIGWVPSPFDPNGFPVHYGVVYALLTASLLSLCFVMPAIVMLRNFRGKYWVHACGFWLVTYAMLVAWLLTDPGQFFLWFAD